MTCSLNRNWMILQMIVALIQFHENLRSHLNFHQLMAAKWIRFRLEKESLDGSRLGSTDSADSAAFWQLPLFNYFNF